MAFIHERTDRLECKLDEVQTIKEGRAAAAQKAPETALEDTPMKCGKPIWGNCKGNEGQIETNDM